MTTALRFAGYGFTYAGAGQPSLHDVTLDLPGASIVCVLAAQGAGKTTLLRAAAGLLGQIYQGEATGVCQHDGSRRPGAFFDGYVQVTLAVETVRDEIALPLQAAGAERSERDAAVSMIARELRIEHLLDREVIALSGGEEKLVGIAAALVAESDVHILDEPFEQLDVRHYAAVICAAKGRARAGRLVLIATSSIDTAVNIGDAIVCLDADRWRLIDRATLADLAKVRGLEESTLARFLNSHGASLAVRSFREGVRQVS